MVISNINRTARPGFEPGALCFRGICADQLRQRAVASSAGNAPAPAASKAVVLLLHQEPSGIAHAPLSQGSRAPHIKSGRGWGRTNSCGFSVRRFYRVSFPSIISRK